MSSDMCRDRGSLPLSPSANKPLQTTGRHVPAFFGAVSVPRTDSRLVQTPVVPIVRNRSAYMGRQQAYGHISTRGPFDT